VKNAIAVEKKTSAAQLVKAKKFGRRTF